tara:strand:- start:758 stop:967 length:210 start_codon:yes stop_codon:yes gene_type:complete
MAPKKKSPDKIEDMYKDILNKIKGLEDRIVAIESTTSKVIKVDKDLDETYGWLEDLDSIVQKIKNRMGL